MSSIRGIWIVKEKEGLICSRRFNTVESRAKRLGETVSIPEDASFLSFVLNKISNWNGNQSHSSSPSSTSNVDHPQRFNSFSFNSFSMEIMDQSSQKSSTKSLWPIVFIKRDRWILICIPCVEEYHKRGNNHDQSNILHMPYITAVISLLEGLYRLFNPFESDLTPLQLADIQIIISKMIPFGRPNDIHLENVSSSIKQNFQPFQPEGGERRPIWKPNIYKGKQRIEFLIQDNIQCVQYDSKNRADEMNVSGTILCKAELEGVSEVTGSIVLPTKPSLGKGVVTSFSLDSCVQSSDQNMKGSGLHKICFRPPLGEFSLCKYSTKYLGEIPIRGFYQLKEISPTQVNFLIQLKLSSKVANNFQYCEVEIPFPNRGLIRDLEAVPTGGNISISPNKRGIQWTMGQKFTHKNLQAALPANVTFEAGSMDIVDDPFLVGTNAFILVHFKLLSECLTTIEIDPNNLITLVVFFRAKR
eukprot:TRINITY_DN894_c1_g1_i1.p1 TRINITY_DN894_c1_g1~~TRINITY_DN894_c1_g1_i1.p1  ORF type:complete len:472 (+),score=56.07 TRINITY_DN894_c1_g1_i1:76-1491(+)